MIREGNFMKINYSCICEKESEIATTQGAIKLSVKKTHQWKKIYKGEDK